VTSDEVGPEHRFRELYRRHAPQVLGYGLRRVADPQDAADVCAETFTVAWRRIEDVPDGDSALPWLYTVAGYTLSNILRGKQRQWAVADRLRDHIGQVTQAHPVSDRRLDAMGRALGGLSDSDRELLQLTLWEELTPAEAAQVLGLDVGVVRSRLHRARARLRAALLADASVLNPEGNDHD